jgi:hypothetical protein
MSATTNAPAWYITLPPGILLDATEYPDSTAFLHYSGWPEDLLAAGIITQAHLRPTDKGWRSRPAHDGGRIAVARRWKVRERTGKPARYFDVKLERPITAVAQWPGALEALAARERYDAWHRAQYPDAHMSPEQAAERRAIVLGALEQKTREERRPSLRLVVDNTRKSS